MVVAGFLQVQVLVRQFHAAATCLARAKHMKRIQRLHKHWAKQLFKPQPEYVDPVLGRPQVPFLERIRAQIHMPYNNIDHIDAEELSRLLYGAEKAAKLRTINEEGSSPVFGAIEDNEARKRETLGRILSLNNANQAQYRKLATSMAMREFERFDGDTGSSEVQAAVMTLKIQFMAAHAKEAKKDLQTKRKLEYLVQQRRNILLYLKRKNPERYIWTIEKLGLSDDAVEAEFHMSRKYLWKTQFYGERTLPLKKTKKDTRERRRLEQKRAKAMKYLAHNSPDLLAKIQ